MTADTCEGQSKLSFPTTCPSCDHSPLEADSCAPNKALRNTMRVWLQKQRKKEEAKVTAQTATPAPEANSPATGGPVLAEGADKPLDSVEVAATAGDASFESAAAPTDAEDGTLRTVSASAQPKEVGSRFSFHATNTGMCSLDMDRGKATGEFAWLNLMNTIPLALAGGCSIHIAFCARC